MTQPVTEEQVTQPAGAEQFGPVDIYTPMLWAVLSDDGKWVEYLKVRVALAACQEERDRLAQENDKLREQRNSLHSQLSFRDLQASGGLPEAQAANDSTLCQLCGHPMPAGEEMFNYHGYSGPCPSPPLPKPPSANVTQAIGNSSAEEEERLRSEHAQMQWALENIHMLARRALNASTEAKCREKLPHILRICEQQSPKSLGGSVLRAEAPSAAEQQLAALRAEHKRLKARLVGLTMEPPA